MLGEDLCLFRAPTASRGPPGHLSASRRPAQRGRLPLHGTLPARTTAGSSTGREERRRAVRGPRLRLSAASPAPRPAPTRPGPEGHRLRMDGRGRARRPIEEDVPEEFFDDERPHPLQRPIYWSTNWEVALENSMDSTSTTCTGTRFVVARGGSVFARHAGRPRSSSATASAATWREQLHAPGPRASTCTPNGWRWPDRATGAPGRGCSGRSSSARAGRSRRRGRRAGAADTTCRACSGRSSPTTSTRACACRWRSTSRASGTTARLRPKGPLRRAWRRFLYAALHRWIIEYNFSRQDERVMLNQRYDTPEKLSAPTPR